MADCILCLPLAKPTHRGAPEVDHDGVQRGADEHAVTGYGVNFWLSCLFLHRFEKDVFPTQVCIDTQNISRLYSRLSSPPSWRAQVYPAVTTSERRGKKDDGATHDVMVIPPYLFRKKKNEIKKREGKKRSTLRRCQRLPTTIGGPQHTQVELAPV